MNQSKNNRTLIHRVFSKEHSLILRGDGLRWIEDMLAHYQVSPEDIEDTLNTLATECESEVTLRDASAVVDQHILQTVYDRLLAPTAEAEEPASNADHEADSLISESHTFKVIDAFQIPRLTWSEDRKIFELLEAGKSKPSILGQPMSRSLYLRDRYHVIKQVILRNEHFSPPTVAGGAGAEEREEYMKLTSTRNMLGRAGQRFLLFGMLSRMQDYSYCLEDLDGRVKLDLSNATPAEGFFTEGCFVLAEGEYQTDESFRVLEIGHPPSEQRDVCRKQFAHIDFTGTGALPLGVEAKLIKAESASDTQFIVMSDFYLDNPSVLISFERILEGYEEQFQSSGGGLRPPPVWVLCGDFSQKPFIFDGNMTTVYTALFTKLANSLSKYSNITPYIHLVIVPGPHDPWSSTTLPRSSLPLPIVKPLLASASRIPKENIHLVSNPCRIRWMSQELVIYRENLMGKMCRNLVSESLKDPTSAMDSEREDMAKFLVQTILDQAHLSPLALNIRPVLWEFDQALRLYPMPTTLVLADSYPPYRLTYEGCHVFNPGSFGVGSKPVWANYHLATRTSEESELPS